MIDGGTAGLGRPSPAGNPTVPLLVYLHADRLIGAHARFADCATVPCRDARVPIETLAITLVASAFWSLRRRDLIALEVGGGHGEHRHTVFSGPHDHVMVHRGMASDEIAGGIEGAMLGNLGRGGTATDVICRWARLQSDDPWHDVLHAVIDEAIEEGYLQRVEADGGVLARLLWGDRELQADCARVKSTTTRFEEFVEEWHDFHAKEARLHDMLVGECKRALIMCSERWYA